jgi:hypothetical protein
MARGITTDITIHPRRRMGRQADAEELADCLGELETEVARIRHELDELRRTDATES